MLFFVISVLTLNIILWLVFLIRFKKLFSTDQIVEDTREKVNKIIKEVDTATDRNVYLSKEMTKRLQNLIDEAENRMELFKEATQRLRNMIAEADRINRGTKVTYTEKPDPEAAYELTLDSQKNSQPSLFESTKSIQKNETNLTPDGAAYHEIPLIITKVYDEKKEEKTTISENSDVSHQVRKLLDQGMNAQEIAANLNCSITEVQFIIDML